MPPDTQPPPVVSVPAPVQHLWLAARELSSHDGTRSHRELIHAFRVLADAGALLAPEQLADLDAIRRAADELERSRPSSTWHADYTRYGLDAVVRLFAVASPRNQLHAEQHGYLELLRQLRRQVAMIDPDTLLLEQHRAVARAFLIAARAMYIAHGAAPPEDGARAAGATDR